MPFYAACRPQSEFDVLHLVSCVAQHALGGFRIYEELVLGFRHIGQATWYMDNGGTIGINGHSFGASVFFVFFFRKVLVQMVTL